MAWIFDDGGWLAGLAFFVMVAILLSAAWSKQEQFIRREEEETRMRERAAEPFEELVEPLPKHDICGAILGDSAPCQQPLGHYGKHDYSKEKGK